MGTGSIDGSAGISTESRRNSGPLVIFVKI